LPSIVQRTLTNTMETTMKTVLITCCSSG